MTESLVTVRVPPGIGDIAWIIMKLASTQDRFIVEVSGENPRRSLEFLRLIDSVAEARYGNFGYSHVDAFSTDPALTWRSVRELAAEQGHAWLTLNRWLEEGRSIVDAWPDVAVAYHFKVRIPREAQQVAWDILGDARKTGFGVYMSSRGNNSYWRGWGEAHWFDLCRRLHKRLPQLTFFLIGAPYDADMIAAVKDLLDGIGIPNKTVLGQPLEVALFVIKQMRYLVSFPSGLAVLAAVLRTPVMMFYPEHLEKMMTAWVDPVQVANRTYHGRLFSSAQSAVDFILDEYRLGQIFAEWSERRDVRLDLGAGQWRRGDGFTTVDIDTRWNPDLVADIRDLHMFRDGQVAEIYCSHTLEHFTIAEGPRLLQEWWRVLRPGGRLEIVVPDVGRAAALWARHEIPDEKLLERLAGGDQTATPYMLHKNFFWATRLIALLRDTGFTDVQVIHEDNLDLRAVATRP